VRKITKLIQKDIRKTLPFCAECLIETVSMNLRHQEQLIDIKDVAGIVEFGKFKTSILESIKYFKEESMSNLVESCMNVILDVSGGEDE